MRYCAKDQHCAAFKSAGLDVRAAAPRGSWKLYSIFMKLNTGPNWVHLARLWVHIPPGPSPPAIQAGSRSAVTTSLGHPNTSEGGVRHAFRRQCAASANWRFLSSISTVRPRGGRFEVLKLFQNPEPQRSGLSNLDPGLHAGLKLVRTWRQGGGNRRDCRTAGGRGRGRRPTCRTNDGWTSRTYDDHTS